MTRPLLTTRGLSRDFGGLRAVDKADFSLMPGEIRAIIGRTVPARPPLSA